MEFIRTISSEHFDSVVNTFFSDDENGEGNKGWIQFSVSKERAKVGTVSHKKWKDDIVMLKAVVKVDMKVEDVAEVLKLHNVPEPLRNHSDFTGLPPWPNYEVMKQIDEGHQLLYLQVDTPMPLASTRFDVTEKRWKKVEDGFVSVLESVEMTDEMHLGERTKKFCRMKQKEYYKVVENKELEKPGCVVTTFFYKSFGGFIQTFLGTFIMKKGSAVMLDKGEKWKRIFKCIRELREKGN